MLPNSQKKLRRKVEWILISAFVCLIAATAVWHALERPRSYFEYQFLDKLSKQRLDSLSRLDLKDLAPAMELVCDAHGYGGPLYLEKYGRTYPAVSDLQDGAWGTRFHRAKRRVHFGGRKLRNDWGVDLC